MRIIAGTARRILLDVPPGDGVRPTADRAREALFAHLGPLTGKRVLDLCAGAGGLGLEAASRGAAEVTLIERNPRHCAVLETNLERVERSGIAGRVTIQRGDATHFSLWPENPDLVLADPPYADSAELFRKIALDPRFPAAAKLVWEIPDAPGAAGDFLKLRDRFAQFEVRRFGGTDFVLAEVKR